LNETIYKIFRTDEWREFERSRLFEGSEHDRRDGFIHFSTGTQLHGTLAKHYKDEQSVVIAAIASGELAINLKWEVSRGGDHFPHLYAPLPYSALEEYFRLERNEGVFDLAALELGA
jgi:uncharacterized protein (DUF952 family)